MHQLLDSLFSVILILSVGYLLSTTIGMLATLFVQDLIDRHECRFHGDDGKRSAAGTDEK